MSGSFLKPLEVFVVQSNILDICWLVVVAAAVFTKAPKSSEVGEEFSKAGTMVFPAREPYVHVCL